MHPKSTTHNTEEPPAHCPNYNHSGFIQLQPQRKHKASRFPPYVWIYDSDDVSEVEL